MQIAEQPTSKLQRGIVENGHHLGQKVHAVHFYQSLTGPPQVPLTVGKAAHSRAHQGRAHYGHGGGGGYSAYGHHRRRLHDFGVVKQLYQTIIQILNNEMFMFHHHVFLCIVRLASQTAPCQH